MRRAATTPLPSSPLRGSDAERIPRVLWGVLVLTVLYHGGLLLHGTYKGTYDSYVHIFFANHYERKWFSTWDPRWYTGFTLSSYPPGAHQAVAASAHVIGLRAGFCMVQTLAVLNVVFGVYRYSRIWVQPRTAAYAAGLATMSTGVAETIHVFGQLPTTYALGFLLNSAPFAHAWVAGGRRRDLVTAVALVAATSSGHHVTTIFGGVFFLAPTIATAMLRAGNLDRPGPAWNLARVRGTIGLLIRPAIRAGIFGFFVGSSLILVLLPYWMWSASDPILQVPIPHGSRQSFIKDVNAGIAFFAIPWGLMIVVLPFALWRGMRSRTKWPLAGSVALLTLLGTGGTTPLPRIMLGGAFDILTLDRFTFWATIAVLPLSAEIVASFLDRVKTAPTILGPTAIIGAVLALGASLFAANFSQYRPLQPRQIDPQPIVSFLAKDQHWRWRYLALGFGDQMAWLSAMTPALSIDGNYHSARRLPEMITTSVERLEGAKFRGVAGLGSLQQFLAYPDKYRLKFIFNNDEFYDPLLHFSGWTPIGRLDNGVRVWQRDDVPPLPSTLPTKEMPRWQTIWWGIGPPAALLSGITLLALRMGTRARRISHDGDDLKTMSAVPMESRVAPRIYRGSTVLIAVLPVVGIAAVAGGVLALHKRQQNTPAATVKRYYLALDLADLGGAYANVDQRRLTFEGFNLRFSARGGLLASYAKLDTITTKALPSRPGTAKIRVNLTYMTALKQYHVQRDHELVKLGGQWRMRPVEPDRTVPADQLNRSPVVEYYGQGRRRVGELQTRSTDTLDRPHVQIGGASLIRLPSKRWAVVGMLLNDDVDPADVTVNATLYDRLGRVLTQYNAAQGMVHQLRPGETTPFRVDFEGVAGAFDPHEPAAGSFRPEQFTPPQLSGRPVAFSVDARAVVTSGRTSPPLSSSNLRIVMRDGKRELRGTLFNGGVREATIPHVLLTSTDASQRMRWIADGYLAESIPPGRSSRFAVEIPKPGDVQLISSAGGLAANGRLRDADIGLMQRPLPRLPGQDPRETFRLSVGAYGATR